MNSPKILKKLVERKISKRSPTLISKLITEEKKIIELHSNINIPKLSPEKSETNLRRRKIVPLKHYSEVLTTKKLNSSFTEIKEKPKEVLVNYCPHCQHCNKIEDPELERNIMALKETKNIIMREAEFILNSNIIPEFNNDFLFQTNKDIFKESKEINDKLNSLPKQTPSNRFTYITISYFLNALIEDKVRVETILNSDSLAKYEKGLLSKGNSFYINDGTLIFDRELEKEFEPEIIEIIKKQIDEKSLEKLNKNHINQDLEKKSKKFFILYLVLLQILGELAVECKERAILLYKFFKIYFSEIEKKWIIIIESMKDKIKFYKELCLIILQQKKPYVEKIEHISEVLLSNNVTLENLKRHKKLVNELLMVIQEKKEEIYLLQNSVTTLEKEIKFWIYDFDSIKVSKELRKRMEKTKKDTLDQMIQNVNQETSHKVVLKDSKALLINADIFLLISGHRSYFYDQKKNLLGEIDRLNNLYKDYYYKKKVWKQKFKDKELDSINLRNKYEAEISYYRSREIADKIEVGTETEIDFLKMNKIIMTYTATKDISKINSNKLQNYVDKVVNKCSKQKPLSINSLLNLISEVYNEKLNNDEIRDLDKLSKLQMDEFLYIFMSDKFKINKLVKKHCEETILSILTYSNEDNRVELFRKFLGINSVKLRREILDFYLGLLKILPVSFYKLFSEKANDYYISTEFCLEVYFNKFPYFGLVKHNFDHLIRLSKVYYNGIEQTAFNDLKTDIFLISRFCNKSTYFFNEMKSNIDDPNYPLMEKIYEYFSLANQETIISQGELNKLLQRMNLMDENYKLNVKELIKIEEKFVNFKIRMNDFCDISLESIIDIYNTMVTKITRIFNNSVLKNEKFLKFKEFKKAISLILTTNENEWELLNYFNKALNKQDKDFITIEEFISFCLNYQVILNTLLNSFLI